MGSPSGWYENADGVLQWWDGEAWGPIAPSQQPPQIPVETLQSFATSTTEAFPAKKKGSGATLWIGAFVVVVIVTGIFAAMNGPSSSETPVTDPQASESVAETEVPPEPTKSAEQILDTSVVAQGFTTVTSGDTYFRYLTDAEMADGRSCGYSRCTWVVIYSHNGCSGGYYVKADILSGDVGVGWTNEISSGAPAGGTVVVQLDDHQGVGETFRVSEINCMG